MANVYYANAIDVPASVRVLASQWRPRRSDYSRMCMPYLWQPQAPGLYSLEHHGLPSRKSTVDLCFAFASGTECRHTMRYLHATKPRSPPVCWPASQPVQVCLTVHSEPQTDVHASGCELSDRRASWPVTGD